MTDNLGAGRARDLRLMAGDVYLDRSTIGSRPASSGAGGNVALHVGGLTLTGGAQISTGSSGSGRSGMLTVAATDMISIAGHDQDGHLSGLFSNAFNLGDAGQIVISAPALTMDAGLI